MKKIFLGLVLAAIVSIVGYAVAIGISGSGNDSGNPSEQQGASEPAYISDVANSSPDSIQPAPSLPPVQGGTSGLADVEGSAPASVATTPLWERLQELGQQDCTIQLEVGSDVDAATLDEIEIIESLWNGGSHTEAIERLKALENTGLHIAAGISPNAS
jgi:hypothetical protein